MVMDDFNVTIRIESVLPSTPALMPWKQQVIQPAVYECTATITTDAKNADHWYRDPRFMAQCYVRLHGNDVWRIMFDRYQKTKRDQDDWYLMTRKISFDHWSRYLRYIDEYRFVPPIS